MAKGYYDIVLEVVEIFRVEALNEELELVLQRLHPHLFEDQGGLGQHGDGLERVREPRLALHGLNQTLAKASSTSSNSATASLISGLFSFMSTVKAWTFHRICVRGEVPAS